ncbi:lysoplasmalogenase [Lentibacter sp. XHP0401]|uniref:lysoplasmalogenase n=1 Tax=Lentibacter sp. XHP0401 TaxID=2984334 RepID=UPI0021E8C314|nr:lysoplasmalogenase [Lentibacter sp. XHP0401]MCV2894029.1 lysoplasmalogenase [Lentibacter sp. XHP0401]
MFGWPNDATLLFLAAAFCSACYLVICGRPGSSWLKSVLKTASVALLALIAFKLSDMLLLAVGLTACAVGDFFLSRKGTEEFVSGIGAFAFGHLSYTALFFLQPSADFLRISDGWPLTLALVLLGLVMIFLLFRTAGKLRWATIIYVPVIMSMGVMAMILPPVGALALVLPAALLFIFSDFVLAQEMFVLPKDHKLQRVLPYTVWSAYWLSQALFLMAFTGTL